jgi:hypothetical protein
MDLREDGLLGSSIADHWYYRTKSAAVEVALGDLRPRSVLDVGAGTGFFSRQLLKHEHVAIATCIDTGYVGDHDETAHGKPLLFRREAGASRAELVLLMDVLEHVENDGALLAAYVARVDQGTRFVITVPAFSWLWSGHDVFLGHYRRYTLGQIRRVVEASGLVVDEACYLYGALFPLAVGTRLLSRLTSALFGQGRARSQMRLVGRLLNRALWLVCDAELLVFRRNRFFGLTAMIVARKPA